MIIFHIIFSIILIVFFLGNESKDLFNFTIMFSLFYFLPLFFGEVYIYNGNMYIYKGLNFSVYLIFYLFVMFMYIFHYINKAKKHKFKIKYVEMSSKDIYKINNFLFIIFLISTVILIIKVGRYLLIDKTKFPGGFWAKYYTVYKFFLLYLLVINYRLKDKSKLLILSIFLIMTYVQNYRTYTILFVLTILIYEVIINKRGVISIRNSFIFLTIVFIGFFGKTIISLWRLDYSFYQILEYIFDKEIVVNSITKSEPFITQYILNDTIEFKIDLSLRYIIRYFYKLIFLSPDIHTNIKSFYDTFVSYYPNVNYGVAYNIFAESYAIGGILAVILFSILYGLIILYLNRNIYNKNIFKSSSCLCLASIYTFFFFRNSIENLILWTQLYLGFYLITLLYKFFSTSKIKIITK